MSSNEPRLFPFLSPSCDFFHCLSLKVGQCLHGDHGAQYITAAATLQREKRPLFIRILYKQHEKKKKKTSFWHKGGNVMAFLGQRAASRGLLNLLL